MPLAPHCCWSCRRQCPPPPWHAQKLHLQLPACTFSGGKGLSSVMPATLQAAESILSSPRVNMLRLFLLFKLFWSNHSFLEIKVVLSLAHLMNYSKGFNPTLTFLLSFILGRRAYKAWFPHALRVHYHSFDPLSSMLSSFWNSRDILYTEKKINRK